LVKKNQVRFPSSATFQRIIHEVIFAAEDTSPLVSWDNIHVRRYQSYLYIDRIKEIYLPPSTLWTDFPNPLSLTDAGIVLTAKKADEGIGVPQDAAITIRFRQGGNYFPGAAKPNI
jgi:tRNA(Ile)-lysidine synthase